MALLGPRMLELANSYRLGHGNSPGLFAGVQLLVHQNSHQAEAKHAFVDNLGSSAKRCLYADSIVAELDEWELIKIIKSCQSWVANLFVTL